MAFWLHCYPELYFMKVKKVTCYTYTCRGPCWGIGLCRHSEWYMYLFQKASNPLCVYNICICMCMPPDYRRLAWVRGANTHSQSTFVCTHHRRRRMIRLFSTPLHCSWLLEHTWWSKLVTHWCIQQGPSKLNYTYLPLALQPIISTLS